MNTRDLFDQFNDEESSDDSEDIKTETLTLVIHDELNTVIRVSETGEGRIIVLPRKSIKIEPTGRRIDVLGKPKLAIAEVTMPVWLAKDRGLI